MAGPVIETRVVGLAPAYLPAEDLLVEGGRLMDVDGGYVQVGEAPCLARRVSTPVGLLAVCVSWSSL